MSQARIASCLFGVQTDKITAVMLHMEGRVLHVFQRRFAVGCIVQTGGILDLHTGEIQIAVKYWRVLDHSTWREARKIIADLTYSITWLVAALTGAAIVYWVERRRM